MQLGANAYMGKPYREDALLALLSEMLADKHSSKIVSGIATNPATEIGGAADRATDTSATFLRH